MPSRVLKLATSVPWAIEPAMLQTILTIANGEGPGPEAVAERIGKKLDNTRTVTMRDGVAIIPVVGPIMRYGSFLTEVSGATSISALALDLRAAVDDPDVKAILLDVNSPGGEVTGVSEFAAQVRAARARKPIGAYIGGAGASAAYWIASAADTIIANDTARVGSIGVVMAVPNPAADSAADIEIVSSNAPAKRPDVATDAGRAEIQRTVDALEQVFVQAVAEHRGVKTAKVVSDFGRGGVHVGEAAKAAGMVDAIGSFESAIATMKRRGARASQEKKRMSMQNKLGLAETASEQEIEAAVERLAASEKALLDATGAPSGVAALGVVASWKASAEQLPGALEQVRTLEQQAENRERDEVLAKLDAENKITPAQLAAYRDQPLAFVKAYAATAPTITQFAAPQTLAPKDGSTSPPLHNGKAWEALRPAERAALKQENVELYDAMKLEAARRKAPAK